MTTHDALLAAVIANPADDLPRLVLADWYEENGDADRAILIRVMCGKHSRRVECGEKALPGGRWMWSVTNHNMPTFFRWGRVARRVCKSVLGQDVAAWRRIGVTLRRGFIAEVRCTLADWCGGVCGRCRGEGLLACDEVAEYIEIKCAACSGTGRTTGIGPRIIREHPVERVVLTDREPLPVHLSGGYRPPSWSPERFGHRNELPGWLLELVRKTDMHDVAETPGGPGSHLMYEEEETAIAALSDALIAWAKAQ